jgi:hypothetical protein
MPTSSGRCLSLSLPRRLACDLAHFAQQVPTISVERRLSLAPLVHAQQVADSAPDWCAVFLKAYAIVAARNAMLRQAFIPFPWPRLDEHPEVVGAVAVERPLGDEDVVLSLPVHSPERQTILELDAQLRHAREASWENVPHFRRLLRASRWPWPLRRVAWWLNLHVTGEWRARSLGTFALGTVGDHGALELRALSPLTTALGYGTFAADGTIPVRLTCDVRALDGSTAARILAEVEEVLLGEVLNELRYLEALRAA